MSNLILLIEDNEQILYGNERMLKRRGYNVFTALNLKDAREKITTNVPDVIILDIMLPDGSGLDFIREIRKNSGVPILLLTGLTASDDIIRGLSEGGDDYLTKPYDFDVLLARINALLRRSVRIPDVLQKGDLKLDIMSSQALLCGNDLLLTQKEFALLLLLAQNENKIISTEYLYEKVWKTVMNGDTQAIKSTISRLRKKLLGSGYTICGMRGEGYLFELE